MIDDVGSPHTCGGATVAAVSAPAVAVNRLIRPQLTVHRVCLGANALTPPLFARDNQLYAAA